LARSQGRLTRRTLIGGAAAGAAGAAVPRVAAAEDEGGSKRQRLKADVVVVGAGLAGLTTARRLVQKGAGSVVVLEARARVGGRTFTQRRHGTFVDVGGQWVKTKATSYGPAQDRVVALAREVGVKTFPTYYPGGSQDVAYENGVRTTYPWEPTAELPPSPSLLDAATAIVQLDNMAKEVGAEAPWRAAKAAQYDGQTFETWKQANTTTDYGRRILDLGAEAILACEPRDVSLLYLLFYIASAGTLENLISTPQGYQESRFVGGSQQVSKRVARALGGRVILRSPVTRITQKKGAVVVESARATVTCKRVVVAVAPALQAAIDFEPALPPLRAQLLQRFPMGSVIKINVFYDRPFWRDDGLTGFALSDRGPCRVTWDNSPPGGKPGMLVTFIEGRDARHLSVRPARERRAAVLASLARYFGDKAAKPLDYVEHDWLRERWSRGCYVGIMPPGVMLDYGAVLRPPIGRIHWAGTETATRGAGYMEGAVRSGEHAAAAVLPRL
jgi:monoamine oxidase